MPTTRARSPGAGVAPRRAALSFAPVGREMSAFLRRRVHVPEATA
ncbi:MAG: hypothetical protein RML56_02840 [Burkholderiales bacterium]|nr:hypothetical protein [Burkholderiales bacterium]